MKPRFKRFISALSIAGISVIGANNLALASGFQIWEQDASSFANFHAGYAALANNASIAWYNPAGITRIKNQQFVLNNALVITDFKYKGRLTIANPAIDSSKSDFVTAQAGTINVIPALHYVAPINDWLGFGFSVTIPFGLKTDYGKDTLMRYAATVTAVKVIDISPSLGFKVNDKLSLGLGPDIQKMYGEFDQTAGLPIAAEFDTTSINKVNDTAYGYHLGALYEFSPSTRIGISYHSKVRHHLSGTSRFSGPLAQMAFDEADHVISRARVNMTLPAYTVLSGYHQVNQQLALMGTVTHTQWNSMKSLTLQGVSGLDDQMLPTRDLTVNIPQNFRNTVSASVGADYAVHESVLLRVGAGYDQAPIKNHSRTVQLPDSNRYVFSLGAHVQATKSIGIDAGWTHLFISKAKINPPAQQVGPEVITANGGVDGGADAYGIQLVWDMG